MSPQRTDVRPAPRPEALDLFDLPSSARRPARGSTAAGVVAGLAVAAALIVAAYANARHSTGQEHFVAFWCGFFVALGVTAWAGTRTHSRRGRAVVLLGYSGVTFLPKLLMSWSGPVYYDEFGHLRHVNDVLATGRLDVHNAFLPIVQWYPGLAVVTAAVHEVTHLGVWHSGQIVVGASRTVALLCVWRLAVALGLSERRGFLAALVFSLNPSFLYFDSEFAYESLGLPLTILALTLAAFARRSPSRGRAIAWGSAATIAAACVVPTHHLSAVISAGMLLALTVFVPARPGRPAGVAAEIGPWIATSVAAIGIVIWATWVAPATVDYLRPHVDGALGQLGDLVRHRVGGTPTAPLERHKPFAANSLPGYEIVCGYLAQLVVGLVTLAAVVRAWQERSNRQRSLMFVPSLVLVFVYFISLPLALTAAGGEPAHRMWPFTYVGVALVVASGAWPIRRTTWRFPRPAAAAVVAVATAVVAIGNVAAGVNIYYRFPGPSVFGTDTRSQTREVRDVAAWSNQHLPPGAKVVTDRFTGEVLTAYTKLLVQSPDESYATMLYREGDDAGTNLRSYLAAHRFRYWIVDERILTQQPVRRFFQGYVGRESVSAPALEAAGMSPQSFLSLVYATPNYRIYEMTP